jgi:hypothetical protein
MSPCAGLTRRRRVGLLLIQVAVASLLAACGGGSSHRARTPTVSPPSGSVPAPPTTGTFLKVSPGLPGLETVAIHLPAAAVSLTPSAVSSTSTLSRRITSARAGAVIHLAAGKYPQIVDHVARTGWVTVSGEGDATKPVIAGTELFGATHVRFIDVDFSTTVKVNRSVSGEMRSGHIEVLNSEIDCDSQSTKPNTIAIAVRGASYDVAFSGDWVHNCTVGFKSEAQAEVSRNISITHSLFENLFGDAIDLGGDDGVTIANDVIRDIHRTHGFIYHDDGIQFFGNCANVLIAYNVEALSTDQLIFIQDAVKSKYTHSSVNQDILVLGNLLYSAGAFAVQDQGGVNVQFVGNTIWHNKDGGLLIRRSGYTHIVPTRTLVADNVIAAFQMRHTPHIVQGYNVFGATHKKFLTSTDALSESPGFVDEDKGLFGLTKGSPASRAPAPSAKLIAMARQAHASAAAIAVLRKYSASYRGALAVNSSQPSFGVPRARRHLDKPKHDIVASRVHRHQGAHAAREKRKADKAKGTATVTTTTTRP